MSAPKESTTRSPRALQAVTRHYGAGPLHVLALLASFALAGYVVSRVAGVAHHWQMLLWFAGALVVNDLVLFPLYSLADRSLRHTSRSHPDTLPRVPWINHFRAPAVISGSLLLISFPMVFRLDPTDYHGATNLAPDPYLARWLLITAGLFAASALLYAVRLGRASRPHRAPNPSGPALPPTSR